MSDHETTRQQAGAEVRKASVRRYQAPTLTAYGSVAKLTQSGDGSGTDAGGPMNMVTTTTLRTAMMNG